MLGCILKREGMDWIKLAWDAFQWEHSNEPAGSVKCRAFVDWLSGCQLFKEVSAVYN